MKWSALYLKFSRNRMKEPVFGKKIKNIEFGAVSEELFRL